MEIKIKHKTDYLTIYTYEDETGDAEIKVYHVFPGLEVTYASAHTSRIDFSYIFQIFIRFLSCYP